MNSLFLFIISIIVSVIVWMLWSTRNIDRKKYFKSDDFKGILKGVLLAILFSIIVGSMSFLSGCSGSYINDASVYAGLDHTKKLSPMCEQIGPDDRTTSNIGLRGNLYESNDKRFRTNLKYTHHSCAFSPDDRSYDSIGMELEYKFWEK